MLTSVGFRRFVLTALSACVVCAPLGCTQKTTSTKKQAETSPDPELDIFAQPTRGDVSQLVKLLSTGTSDERQKAATALGVLRDDAVEAVPALMTALSDTDSATRSSAATALGLIGSVDSSDNLLQAAQSDDDPSARTAMWTALGLLGATSHLADSSLTAADQEAAIVGLSQRPDQTVKDQVLDIWLESESSGTRTVALLHIGELAKSDDAQVAKIVSVVADDDESVRIAAVQLLDSLNLQGQPLINSLTMRFAAATTDEQKSAIQQKLVASDGDVVSDLTAMLQSDTSADAKRVVAQLLIGLPPETLQQGHDSLKSASNLQLPDAETAGLLALAIRNAGGEPSQQDLVNFVISPGASSEQRLQALSLLEASESPEVANLLADYLPKLLDGDSSEGSTELATAFLLAIETQGDQAAGAMPAVGQLLAAGENDAFKDAALQTLLAVEPNGEATTAALAAAIRDASSPVHAAAMKVAESATPQQVAILAPSLAENLADADPEQQKTRLALLQKGGPAALAAASPVMATLLSNAKTSDERKTALQLLTQLNPSSTQDMTAALQGALSDEDEDVRAHAVSLLAESDSTSQQAIEALMAAAQDSSPKIQLSALKALAAAGREAAGAKPLFEKILDESEDAEHRKTAIAALASLATAKEAQLLVARVIVDAELQGHAEKIVLQHPQTGIAALADATNSEDAEESSFAAGLLSKLSKNKAGRKGLAALAKSNVKHRGLALLKLGSVPSGLPKKDAANALLPFIRKGKGRPAAWELLDEMGNDVIPALGEWIADEELTPDAKMQAIRLMAGTTNSELAAPILEALLEDDSTTLGTEAALALATMDPESEAAAATIAAALGDTDSGLPTNKLLKALTAMNVDSSDTVRQLLTAEGTSSDVRKMALNQLLKESPMSDETAAALTKAAALDDPELKNQISTLVASIEKKAAKSSPTPVPMDSDNLPATSHADASEATNTEGRQQAAVSDCCQSDSTCQCASTFVTQAPADCCSPAACSDCESKTSCVCVTQPDCATDCQPVDCKIKVKMVSCRRLLKQSRRMARRSRK